MPPILQVENVSKAYPGGTQALAGVSLDVDAGEIVCLLGPSGSGKTTLLRVVAGLERPDQGQIHFQGRDLANVPTHRRGFGFMFQDFALFPHRNVAENVAFGLRMAGASRDAQRERVATMLELVNLHGYAQRSTFELSGGERQRVALARSLAPQPALLMLDEPLGSLDRGLREELVEELRTILKDMGVTALYVTHDQDEAMALGDRLVIMQRGRIEQVGTPTEVYTHPATPFAARFLGFTNLIPATPTASGINTPLGNFPLHASSTAAEQTLLLRPEAARLAPLPTTNNPGFHAWAEDNSTAEDKVVLLQGHLRAMTYHGSHYRVDIEVDIEQSDPADRKGVGSVLTLNFELPAVQRASDQSLWPITLPPVGEPIALLIYPALATLLPYPSTATSARG